MGLNINNITKIYSNGMKANDNISFTLEKKQCIGLIGKNGCGKTTLIRQILKILKSTDGSIDINGNNDYLDLVAYVPQNPPIYPALTVEENIDVILKYACLKKDEREERINNVLVKTGLDAIKNHLAYTLSGGQMKLLALANAIVIDKDFLILDEPTAMVDIVTKETILGILDELKQEKAILISSHDMSEIYRITDKLLILKDGKQIYSGDTVGVGDGICKLEISSSDNDIDKEYFSDLGQAIDFIESYKKDKEIKSLKVDYPAFEEGVIKYVK